MLMLVCGLALIMHAGMLVAVHRQVGALDIYAFQSLDCGEFYRTAINLLDHVTFSQSDTPPYTPDTWRTPGYPLFLAACMGVIGRSPTGLVVAQQLLCVVNIALVFVIARRYMSERRAGLVAVLCLFEPYHLYYSLWLLSTTWFVTVLLLGWYAFERARAGHRPAWFAVAGALIGLLVLIRPVAMLVPIALLAGLVWSTWKRRRAGRTEPSPGPRPSWGEPVVFALCCGLVIGSWMTRNLVSVGHFAISDQGGVVLAYFKAAEVELWQQGRTDERYRETSLNPAYAHAPHTVWDGIDAELRARLSQVPPEAADSLRWRNLAQGNQSEVDRFEVSRALARIGLSRLISMPLASLTCGLVRCGSLLTFPLNLAIRPAADHPPRRARSLALAVPYLLLCVAVIVALARGGLRRGELLFPLACTIALQMATTPQVDPRFRVPMIPLLIFVALLPVSRRRT